MSFVKIKISEKLAKKRKSEKAKKMERKSWRRSKSSNFSQQYRNYQTSRRNDGENCKKQEL